MILYLTTDESPLSPQMRARTGFRGVSIGAPRSSGVSSVTGDWPSFSSDSERQNPRTLHYRSLSAFVYDEHAVNVPPVSITGEEGDSS